MSEPLRILFVEDSPHDVELEEAELRKGGLTFTSRRVQTRADLERALKEFSPDLIISDYAMPGMDGLKALQISRGLCPEVPFIFVSGTIGEERAIESLKDGATDYVVKDRLGSLASKVSRAIREVKERAEHRRLEQQLRQAQKMEAVGRLAGGIAHDFNNLLTVINGYSQLISARLPAGDSTRADAEEIQKAGDRAAALTRQLLAFSRKQIMAPVVLNLNRIVSEMEKMLRRLIGEDIELVTSLDPGLGNVKADSGQIEQVIMNLAVNARDAMIHGGKLTLETANVTLDEGFARDHAGAHIGPHAMLGVSDTGVGMDQETQSHLFEPFFTTKEQGKGTGLGLSTVYGIVKQTGGSIWAYSEPGQGTTFKIYLPRVDDPADSSKPTKRREQLPRGTETILLVEDAEGVRNLIRQVLTQNGYTLLAAEDGEQAFKLVEQHAGPIHLLLTDIVLPRMGGPEIAHRLRALRPGIGVLFTSGYTDRGVVENGVLESGIAFLQKPFAADELRRRVREVLGPPP
jgi:two-component system cell cycle sensor histidine kinase/response regulator CckA